MSTIHEIDWTAISVLEILPTLENIPMDDCVTSLPFSVNKGTQIIELARAHQQGDPLPPPSQQYVRFKRIKVVHSENMFAWVWQRIQ